MSGDEIVTRIVNCVAKFWVGAAAGAAGFLLASTHSPDQNATHHRTSGNRDADDRAEAGAADRAEAGAADRPRSPAASPTSPAAYYQLYRVDRDRFFEKLEPLSDLAKLQVCKAIHFEFGSSSLAWEFFERNAEVMFSLPRSDVQFMMGGARLFNPSAFNRRMAELIELGKTEQLERMFGGPGRPFRLSMESPVDSSAGERRVVDALRQLAKEDFDQFCGFYSTHTKGGFFRTLPSAQSAALLADVRDHGVGKLETLTMDLARCLDESGWRAVLEFEGEADGEADGTFFGNLLVVAEAENLDVGIRKEIAERLPDEIAVDSILLGLEMRSHSGDVPVQDVVDASRSLLRTERFGQLSTERGARLGRLLLEGAAPAAVLGDLGENMGTPASRTVFTEVVREWGRFDPMGASAFLSKRIAAGDAVPEPAVRALAANLEEYPEAAAAWDRFVKDEK